MFGRATITLGIGPHSSLDFSAELLMTADKFAHRPAHAKGRHGRAQAQLTCNQK